MNTSINLSDVLTVGVFSLAMAVIVLIVVGFTILEVLKSAMRLLDAWYKNTSAAMERSYESVRLMCKSVDVFVDASNSLADRLSADRGNENDDGDDGPDDGNDDSDLFGPQGYTHPVTLEVPDSMTDDADNDPDRDLLVYGPPTVHPHYERPTDDSTPNEPEPFPRPDPQTPEKDDVLREIAEMRDLQARIDAFAREGDELVDNARQTGEMANALVDKLHDLSEGRIEKAVPCLNDGNGSWGVIAMGRSIFRNSRDVTSTLDRGLGEWFSNARKN